MYLNAARTLSVGQSEARKHFKFEVTGRACCSLLP